jgi:hypothetical protein
MLIANGPVSQRLAFRLLLSAIRYTLSGEVWVV